MLNAVGYLIFVFNNLRFVTEEFIRALSASHTGLTTMLRPSCDLKMLESWENRRLVARLVAAILGDRG